VARRCVLAILSNGEDSIEAHLSNASISVKAGELVRFLQFPVFGQHGAFDHLHDYDSGRVFAMALPQHTSQQYGTAGIAFLERLTRDRRDFAGYLEQCQRIFEQHYGPLSAEEGRAARSFALIGMVGELASEYGVTGWLERIVMEAALICFKHWRRQRGPFALEPQQLANVLGQYVELYGDRRFTKTDDPNRLHGERSGYWRQTGRGRQWLFSTAGFKKAIGHADLAQSTDELSPPDDQHRATQSENVPAVTPVLPDPASVKPPQPALELAVTPVTPQNNEYQQNNVNKLNAQDQTKLLA